MRQPPHTLATDGVLKLAILQKSVVGLRVDRRRVIATCRSGISVATNMEMLLYVSMRM